MEQFLTPFLQTFSSVNTQKSYARDLNSFFEFCAAELNLRLEHPEQITEKLILVWFQSCREGSNATRARRLSSLSSFLEYLKKKKVITKNEVHLLNRPKVPKAGKTNVLTQDEMVKMLTAARKNFEFFEFKNSAQHRIWYLRYVVLYTLLSVGMRVEELCQLRLQDLQWTGACWKLHMRVKGNELHAPIIHEKTAKLLCEYKEKMRIGAQPHECFFVRTQNTDKMVPLHRATVFTMVKLCAKEAQIDKNISPHSCRATLATLLHQNAVPISQIQTLLNHKQMSTTSVYIRKLEEAEQAAALKLNFFK